ncbi:MAG: metal-sulfur cluster assembly factor [Desulfurococcaceae archaeon]
MTSHEDVKRKVLEVLETVIDPEIGIDVYNLGLIYDVQVVDEKHVKISMGLTTMFCPLAPIIPLMIIDQLKERLGIDADIDLVYDPPWTPLRMTDKGRAMFKERFGYDIVEMYSHTTKTERE